MIYLLNKMSYKVFRILAFNFFVLVSVHIFSSCTDKSSKPDIEKVFEAHPDLKSLVEYAEGFDLYQYDSITKVVVYHPVLPEEVIETFYVAGQSKADSFQENKHFFVSPIDSVAIFSATQINALDKLNLLDKIVGVSEASYIKNSYVQQQYSDGKITELAGSGDFYVETTMMVNPSVIFYSPSKVIESHPLEVTGVPLIPFYDYMETDPLGRAEWLKFTAVFFNRYGQADSIFRLIEAEYKNYREIVGNTANKPTIFSDKYFNGQWYVPGGKSYLAKLFADAGADYIWKNDLHKSSFPLDYEVVYKQAFDADYWRIVGSFGEEASYDALLSQNELYKNFRAFKEKKVIWCDAENSAYFETSPLEPHIVLADLIKALHPELLPDHKPRYYYILP